MFQFQALGLEAILFLSFLSSTSEIGHFKEISFGFEGLMTSSGIVN
jgi:hypothetical protein